MSELPQGVDAVLSVAQLIDKMRTGSHFTIDEIIQMLSACDDKRESFMVHMGGFTYVVEAGNIKEYFEQNPKPTRPISKEEENQILKGQIKRMEEELLRLRGKTIKPQTKPEVHAEPAFDSDSLDAEPLPLETQESEQIRLELAEELRGKTPLRPKARPKP